VLVDGYDMAGGGIVRDVLDASGEDGTARWTTEVGAIDRPLREAKNGHRALLVVVTTISTRTGRRWPARSKSPCGAAATRSSAWPWPRTTCTNSAAVSSR
jgi:hypothetical protein